MAEVITKCCFAIAGDAIFVRIIHLNRYEQHWLLAIVIQEMPFSAGSI